MRIFILRKRKILMIVGVVLVIAILFLIFGTPRYQSIKLKNKDLGGLEDKLKEAVNTNTEIDISKLTEFDWDECYVFPPYYPSEAIYKKVGAEWTTTKTYVQFLLFHHIENQTVNDDQYIVVFKKDNTVILSAKYSLNQLPIIFKLNNYKFVNSNAKFIVSAAKKYEGGKIKELDLKK